MAFDGIEAGAKNPAERDPLSTGTRLDNTARFAPMARAITDDKTTLTGPAMAPVRADFRATGQSRSTGHTVTKNEKIGTRIFGGIGAVAGFINGFLIGGPLGAVIGAAVVGFGAWALAKIAWYFGKRTGK